MVRVEERTPHHEGRKTTERFQATEVQYHRAGWRNNWVDLSTLGWIRGLRDLRFKSSP